MGNPISHFLLDTQVWQQQSVDPKDRQLAKNDPTLWRKLFPFPQADDNKYSRGHALVCGGELMTGATRMAARAAQRMGAGLVTLAAPSKVAQLYSETLESVIVRPLENDQAWRSLVQHLGADAFLIGPGLGIGQRQAMDILAALKVRKPIVLDADVFSNFSHDPDTLLSHLHSGCVLTPHEGEFNRLWGSRMGPLGDRLERARKAAQETGCILLLKGSGTIIAHPDGSAILNDNAPPWLATAGSGDVLAGMILGLIAQKMPVFAASAAAVWLHGQIASDFGLGLIAEDIIEGIPKVLQKL